MMVIIFIVGTTVTTGLALRDWRQVVVEGICGVTTVEALGAAVGRGGGDGGGAVTLGGEVMEGGGATANTAIVGSGMVERVMHGATLHLLLLKVGDA